MTSRFKGPSLDPVGVMSRALAQSEAKLRAVVQIAAKAQREGDELRAWLIALLRRIGSQRISIEEYHKILESGGDGDFVLVLPTEEDRTIAEIQAAPMSSIEPPGEPAPKKDEPSA